MKLGIPGILIVEDEQDQREMMLKILSRKHPGVIIDSAGTVSEAVELIRSAALRGVQYVVVILDLKLPREKGQTDAFFQFGLRDEVLAAPLSRDAYIFFQSAYLNDEDIQEYKRGVEAQSRNNVQSPRPFFFSKTESEDRRRFYEEINQIMHTRRISQKLEGIMPALFSSPGLEPVVAGHLVHVAPRGPFPYAGADPTHQLADLVRDIEAHWDYLESNLKEYIRRYFVVTETPTGVDVSLL